MKKTLLVVLLITTTILSGCSKLAENTEIDKARSELENHNFDVALDILTEIINENPNNKEARAMYMQGSKMSNALKYESNQDYDKAIKELDYIVNINNGSNVIKRESVNLKEKLEKLLKESEEKALKLKEDAKKSSKKYIQNNESKLKYEEEQRRKEEEEMKKQEEEKEEELPPLDNNENLPNNENNSSLEINNQNIELQE